MQGHIFNIQRYSLHDGPGIRTTVFLSGCPLRCKWCANPESWSLQPQLFYSEAKCIGCMSCRAQFLEHQKNNEAVPSADTDMRGMPAQALEHQRITGTAGEIVAEKEGRPVFYREEMEEEMVRLLSESCPAAALTVKQKLMSAEEVQSVVLRDALYYKKSGGGVTLSGGEPLLQKEFVKCLLQKLKEAGIHTAVETTGCVPWETIEEISDHVDLFLYDFKHIDSEKHRAGTGRGNELIRQNLELLSRKCFCLHVRVPVIPGFNDEADTLQSMKAYTETLGIRQFSLLPFHQLGSSKYKALGIPYELEGLPQMKEEEMKRRFFPETT